MYWYPRSWRDRYGDEFAELLISDIRERPRSATRTRDVARGGVVARRLVTGGHRGLAPPVAAAVAAGLVLLVGGRHFENNWVGTGGQGGLVPGGLAAFTRALALWVTAYWAHLGALTAFPLPERTWMVISPLALAVAALAVALVIRRAGLSPRVLAFEARLASAACAGLAGLLAGSGWRGADP